MLELGIGSLNQPFLFLPSVPSFHPLQNPGTQTSHILSLTMVELAEKLKEGSLSPESVLYSYMDKVSDASSMAGMLQGSPTVGLPN